MKTEKSKKFNEIIKAYMDKNDWSYSQALTAALKNTVENQIVKEFITEYNDQYSDPNYLKEVKKLQRLTKRVNSFAR